MKLFDWVVVPLDGSAIAEGALEVATAVAAKMDAGLWLVAVARNESLLADEEEYLALVGAALPTSTRTTVLHGLDPGNSIVDLVHTSETTESSRILVCMGTHGRRPLAEVVLGSVAATVVSKRPGATLLIGPRYDGTQPPTFKNLVVVIDGSEDTEDVVQLADRWARHLQLNCHVVEVITHETERQMARAGVGPSDIAEYGAVERIAHALESRGLHATWDVLHDHNSARGLGDYADAAGPSIILVGPRIQQRVSDILDHDTAQLVHTSRCPVLLVRT